jgi:hypothetical protein
MKSACAATDATFAAASGNTLLNKSPGKLDAKSRKVASDHGANIIAYEISGTEFRVHFTKYETTSLTGRCPFERMRSVRNDARQRVISTKPSNQTMKPTAPLRNKFGVLATTPWISSRCPASLVRLKLVLCPHSLAPTLVVLPSMSLGPPLHSLGSRTPAVMLFNASRGL